MIDFIVNYVFLIWTIILSPCAVIEGIRKAIYTKDIAIK